MSQLGRTLRAEKPTTLSGLRFGRTFQHKGRTMYAVIASGGKQERVAEGQQLRVELLGVAEGTEVSLQPVLIVDGDRVLATPADLAKSTVTARVIGEEKGKKINAMTYKNKTNQSRRWGHRQHYSTIEITSIVAG